MNVICLYRVSSDTQDLERQITELHELADTNDWEIVEEFGEKKSGFRNAKRDAFDNLIKYIKKNSENVDKILVTELSRIGRSAQKIQKFILLTKELNISLFINSKPKFETIQPDATGLTRMANELMITMLSQFAELEAELISARSVSGKIEKLNNRKSLHIGKIPYGYQLIDKELYRFDVEAEIVERIFKDGLTKGARQIATELNEDKVKSYKNGDNWTVSSVRNILKNYLYLGIQTYKFEVNKELDAEGKNIKPKKKRKYNIFHGQISPIITKELYKNVQLKRRTRKNQQHSNLKYKELYLFSEKLYCCCGKRYKSATYESREGKIKDQYYFCLSKKYDKKCKSRNIQTRKLDDYIWKSFAASQKLWNRILEEDEKLFLKDEKLRDINISKNKIRGYQEDKEIEKAVFRAKEQTQEEYLKKIKSLNKNIRVEENNIKSTQSIIDEFDYRKTKTLLDFTEGTINTEDNAIRRKHIKNHIDKIIIYDCDKDLSSLEYKKNMLKNDAIFYVEIFVLGTSNPLSFVCTNKSSYHKDNILDRFVLNKEQDVFFVTENIIA